MGKDRSADRASSGVAQWGVTASAMAEDREACMAAGVDDYLTKPIRPAELTQIVARLARERVVP